MLSQPAGKLTVKYSPEGKKAASENLTFSMSRMTRMIQRALEAGDILKNSETATPEIEVVIKDMYIRSTVGAVAFGIFAGVDSIEGDVTVLAAEGQPIHKFSVSTSYGFGGWAGGSDSRMEWLYENFSEDILKELKGEEK